MGQDSALEEEAWDGSGGGSEEEEEEEARDGRVRLEKEARDGGGRRSYRMAAAGRRREVGVGKDIGAMEEVGVNRAMTKTRVDKDAQVVRVYENSGTMAHMPEQGSAMVVGPWARMAGL